MQFTQYNNYIQRLYNIIQHYYNENNIICKLE